MEGRDRGFCARRREQGKEAHRMNAYIYEVIRENPDGSQGKRKKTLFRYKPDLEVGGLYLHLGRGFPGMHRILGVRTEEIPA